MLLAGRVFEGPWLDKEIDSENEGVPKHLGRIAEEMYEWEGRIAEELELTSPDVAAIKTKHPFELRLQTYSILTQININLNTMLLQCSHIPGERLY